jgi:hypothetical protein
MLAEAIRYPLRGRAGRDGLAVVSGLVIAALLAVRVTRSLWPDRLVVVPLALLVIPVVLFAGHLGSVLRRSVAGDADPPPFDWSMETPRLGVRVLLVGGGYLLVPAAVLLAVAVAIQGTVGAGLLAGIGATLALLVVVAFAYAMPVGVAATLRGGLRDGLRLGSLGGLRSAPYFVAWTGGTVLVVPSWLLLRAAAPSTLLALVAVVAFAYAHLAAAHLVGEGLARATGRSR